MDPTNTLILNKKGNICFPAFPIITKIYFVEYAHKKRSARGKKKVKGIEYISLLTVPCLMIKVLTKWPPATNTIYYLLDNDLHFLFCWYKIKITVFDDILIPYYLVQTKLAATSPARFYKFYKGESFVSHENFGRCKTSHWLQC